MKLYHSILKKCIFGAVSLLVITAPVCFANTVTEYPNFATVEQDFGTPQSGIQSEMTENGEYKIMANGYTISEAIWDAVDIANTAPLIGVKKDGKWGIMNTEGTLLAEPQYKEVNIYKEYIRFLTFEDKYGFMDIACNIFVQPLYDYVAGSVFDPYNTIAVGRDYGYTVIDRQGNELLPLYPYPVKKAKNCSFFIGDSPEGALLLNQEGKVILKTSYSSMQAITENAFMVSQDEHFGMVNQNGNILIPLVYDNLYWKDDGDVIIAGDAEKRAYYDLQGNLLSGRTWDPSPYYAGGALLPVLENGKYGFINHQGILVIPPRFEHISMQGDYVVQLKGKTGILSEDGSWKVEPKWNISPDHFRMVQNGWYSVMLPEVYQWGLLDSDGNVIVEPIFDAVYYDEDRECWIVSIESTNYRVTFKETLTPQSDALLYNIQDTSAAEELVQQGILLGDESGDLRLYEKVTRGEFLTLLARMDGWADTEALCDFPDVQGHWASTTIGAAVRKGLIRGYADGRFGPDDTITYQQIFTILLRSRGFSEEQVSAQGRAYREANAFTRKITHSFSHADTVSRLDTAILLTAYQTSDLSPETLAQKDSYSPDDDNTFYL